MTDITVPIEQAEAVQNYIDQIIEAVHNNPNIRVTEVWECPCTGLKDAGGLCHCERRSIDMQKFEMSLNAIKGEKT